MLYMPFRSFGRGTTPVREYTKHGYEPITGPKHGVSFKDVWCGVPCLASIHLQCHSWCRKQSGSHLVVKLYEL